MPLYEHQCRTCKLEWGEHYGLDDKPPASCPECKSPDVFRCVTTAGAVHFKGAGWSPDGYNKYRAYDAYGKGGVKIYDRKEDHDREVKGEAEASELAKQKHLDRVSKRAFGPDAGVTQDKADAAIKRAGEERLTDVI